MYEERELCRELTSIIPLIAYQSSCLRHEHGDDFTPGAAGGAVAPCAYAADPFIGRLCLYRCSHEQA